MEEIEVGEYVRTCTGEIYKYENSIEYACKCDNFYGRIVNHNKIISEIVEEGDYVNGERVKMNYEIGELIIPKQIKTIVTKEQMKSVEYEVK